MPVEITYTTYSLEGICFRHATLRAIAGEMVHASVRDTENTSECDECHAEAIQTVARKKAWGTNSIGDNVE